MTKIIKIFLLLLTFVPLIVDNSLFMPTNGSFFLRSLIFLVSLFFLFNFFYKRKFRDGIIEKVNILIKNPIVISILAFVFVLALSTVFAIDKYVAFWGNIERAEGLVGIIYFLSFFAFSLLIFEKKDWLWFFKLSLVISLILLFKEFAQFFSGIMRPGSFLNNPAFLAGYLLFPIFCSLIVWNEGQNKFWKIFSIGILILSILGIFITQTRGTILGLAVGFIAVSVYGILKGRDIALFKKFDLRKVSIVVLCIIFIFSGLFISTRKNEIWQKIPGLSRVAVINSDNLEDRSTKDRLLTYRSGLEAVNPIQNGFKKFIIGWGPENFSLAYGKYFNPKQFAYETGWFDRAHNKLLEVAVMDGILGLIAYLFIYFFFFKSVLRRRDDFLTDTGFLFFGVSFLTHLLFIFDQITTYLPFFSVLAFAICLIIFQDSNREIFKKNKEKYETEKTGTIFISIFLIFLTLFLCFVFIRNDLISYIQIKEYLSLKKRADPEIMLNKINSVFVPFTTAQLNIRTDFLDIINRNYDAKNKSIGKLFDISIAEAEDYLNERPLDIKFKAFLAEVYNSKGASLNNFEFLKKGEEYFREILFYVPNRPDFNFDLALNLFYQKRYEESLSHFEKVFDTSPEYFGQKGKESLGIYTLFLQYFYKTKDKDNFFKTVYRLKENGYNDSAALDYIIQSIEKNNFWPMINFQSL